MGSGLEAMLGLCSSIVLLETTLDLCSWEPFDAMLGLWSSIVLLLLETTLDLCSCELLDAMLDR